MKHIVERAGGGLMRRWMWLGIVVMGIGWTSQGWGAPGKIRLLAIDSYHREYVWSQGTNRGLAEGLLKSGYLDSHAQVEEFLEHDTVESSHVVLTRLWMDTKRKSSKPEQEATTAELTQVAKEFAPTLIFLGDDNAANYIGNQFLDTETPVVFWGVNNTPVKYGLVESAERPGHNVTGVYQSGYYAEGLRLLTKLFPRVKTVAVLSDDTETGRSHVKAIEFLAAEGQLPVTLVESVATNDFALWKQKALALQGTVDAFYVAQYNSLKDEAGKHVSGDDVVKWYVAHITIPEVTGFKEFVEQGLLCAADDSAYNQGFEAAMMAHDILAGTARPEQFPAKAPQRGSLIVNRQRAQQLGLILTPEMGVEEFIEGKPIE